MVKKIIAIIMVLAAVIIFMLDCVCKPKASESLAVTLHPQETSQWCWAASAQMVMDYLGHSVSQCVQANNRFGRSDCCGIDLCPPPTETDCFHSGGHPCACSGWPEFGKYNFDFKTTSNAPLSWDDLRSQISRGQYCEGKPFCFTWHWNGGGGHMMVAIGYKTVSGVNYVEMNDPWSPCVGNHKFITYSAYVSGSGYTHWNDYYDVTYKGGE